MRHPTRHKIGLWLSGLNHTIPFYIFFIYIYIYIDRVCDVAKKLIGMLENDGFRIRLVVAKPI